MDQAMTQTTKNSKRPSSPMDTDIPVKKSSFDQPSFSIGSPINADIPAKKRRFDQPSTSTGGDTNRNSKTCNAFDMSSVKEKLENIATLGSGLKHNMHGPEFQLGMLMLVLWRAYVHEYYEFGLATELEEAEKFDDIVFQSRRNDREEWTLRLIQAKHKEGKTITLVDRANLLAEDDKDFALQKYFHSFIKIQRRCLQNSLFCPFSEAKIKDVLLVTNTDLKTDALKNSFEIDEGNSMKNDELLGLDPMPNTVKYKISESLMQDLKPILKRTSEFNQLVHTLAKSIVKKKQLNKNIAIIMEFIHPLRRDVFNCDKMSGKDVLKFSKAFFDTNHSSSELSKFREALAKEIAFLETCWKFKVGKTFGNSSISLSDEILQKLAQAIKNDSKLQIKDDPGAQNILFEHVINSETSKFYSKFIKAKDDKMLELRNFLKRETGKTNEELGSVKLKISSMPANPRILWGIADAFASQLQFKAEKIPLLEELLPAELRTYETDLAKAVLDVKNGGKLFDNFKFGNTNNDPKLDINEFRRILMDKIVSTKEMENAESLLKNVEIEVSEGLAKCMQFHANPTILDPVRFAQPISELPQPISESQFFEFLNKFRLIVNYPNRHELMSTIQREMEAKFFNLNSRVLKALLHEQLGNWMSERIGTFFTHEKAEELFNKIGKDTLNYIMDGVNQVYFSSTSINYSFKTIEDQICSFLSDKDCHILYLEFEEIALGRIRAVQTFKKLQDDNMVPSKYTRQFGYIFFTLDQLKDDNFQKNIARSFEDHNLWNLLVIECDSEEPHNASSRLNILRTLNISKRKIIFLADQTLREKLLNFSPSVQKVTTRFFDLTDQSQKEISANGKILFQESIRGLNNLLDDDSKELIDASTLAKLVAGKPIKVGNGLVFSMGYDENYYIERSIDNCVEINKNVTIKDPDILIKSESEEEFIETCHKYKGDNSKNIHWLRPNGSRLFWKGTSGNISRLVKFRENKIDSQESRHKPPGFIKKIPENEFIVTNEREKLRIISNMAGMGKTTILSNISKLLKSKYCNLWVLRIDLTEYSEFFSQEQESRSSITEKLRANDLSSGINFLISLLQFSKKSELTTDFELKLLKNSLLGLSQLQVTLLLDGFDEISPTYMEIVLDFIQTLQLTSIQRLIITTRPCTQKNLEERFGTFAWRLNEFSQDEQRWFLMRFWRSRLSAEISRSSAGPQRLAVYVDAIMKKYSASLNDERMKFTGIPLQLKLLAEVFEENLDDHNWNGCKDFVISTQETPELPKRLNIFDLFGKFVKKIYEIYRREKLRQSENMPAAKVENIRSFKSFQEEHEKMALYLIFEEDDLEALFCVEKMEEIQSYISLIETGQETRGIVNQVIHGKPHFIHRSFAEYFASNYFTNALVKESQPESLNKFLLEKVLSSSFGFDTIRIFFDTWLEAKSGNISEDTKLQIGQCAVKVYQGPNEIGPKYLHLSCSGGFTDIVRFLCECLTNYPEDLRKIVNSFYAGRTPLFKACEANDLKAAKILLQHGADVNVVILDEPILHKCLSLRNLQICWWLVKPTAEGGAGADIFARGHREEDTVVCAILSGDLEILKWLVQRGHRLDLTNAFGRTSLHVAVREGHVDIVQWLISMGVDLSVFDEDGQNVLHFACTNGQLKIAELLVTASNKIGAGIERLGDRSGRTPLHIAYQYEHQEIVELLERQG